jgi:predicted permease
MRSTNDPLRGLAFKYRALLSLLPAHVRAEHGRELADDLREAPQSMVHLTSDILRAAPRAHWDVLRQDLTLALRQMRRAPAFAIVAGVTLAIGIGGNVAFFSFVNGVLLTQLPLNGANRLVDITEENIPRGLRSFGLSPANYRDFVADTSLFLAATAYTNRSGTVRFDDARDRITFAAVSGDFFRVFVEPPLLGRTLRADDDFPGSTAIVLSEPFWRRALGADPEVIGRQIEVDNQRLQIVGVMPATFAFPDGSVAFWQALGFQEPVWARRGARSLSAVARLQPGVTVDRAVGALALTARGLQSQFERTNRDWTVLVRGLRDARVSRVRAPLLFIWAAGALVLLIAVANVASLFLTRAVGRSREIALRTALGARSGRVARQLVSEALLLTSMATACGLGFAALVLVRIRPLASAFVPRINEVGLGLRTVGYAALLALVTTSLLSLMATSSLRQQGIWGTLGTARASASRERRRVQRGIVAVEVALAVFVLVGASLVGRTLFGLLHQPMGFDARNVLTFRVEPPWHRDPNATPSQMAQQLERDKARASDGYDRLLEELRAQHGIVGAGAINRLPLTGDWWTSAVRLADRAEETERIPVYVRPATSGYLAAMGTRVLRGRAIERQDRATTPSVVVVDEKFAQWAWGNADPLGREILMDGPPNQPAPRARVVGVVESSPMNRLDAVRRPTMYVPLAQAREGFNLNWGMDVVIRGASGMTVEDIRRSVRNAFPDAAVFRRTPMREIVRGSTADRRFQLVVLGFFGLLALVLATIGVAGTLLLAVRERVAELAVQLALGARPPRLWWHVQREALLLAGLGACIGVAAALAGARVFASLVHGVTVRDPVSIALGPLLMLGASFLAAAVPAARAVRIDPISALRC